LYRVTESEISGMTTGSNSFSMGLCGIAIGIATSCLTTLLTATLTTLIAAFTGATLASFGLALFYGLAARTERNEVFRIVEQIKGRGPSAD
jgi:ABC-type Co2+ transport system permease subunit